MVDLAAMSKDYEIWMNLALELADEAGREDEVPIGAVLVHEGFEIGRGYNRREATGRTVAHAEILAIEAYNTRTGQWRLPPGTTLFVTAEPCVMCAGALIGARVETIVYGCRDTKNAAMERIRPLIDEGIFDHRFQNVVGGVLADRCAKTLSDYFRAKRNGTCVATSKGREGNDEHPPNPNL